MANMDKVKVAVRVRPFNRREVDLGTKCVVDMEETQTVLHHPSMVVKESDQQIVAGKKPHKTFAFDHCFWSMDENNQKYASQLSVFNSLGRDVLDRAFEGYNACIFAYGQTGSGKSYTMMGSGDNKGLIPRLCDTLFEMITQREDDATSCKVEVSYMEIYNEKVRDLLDPNGKHNLKVREHNILGPYVDGLSTLAVSGFKDIESLMSEGNKSRTVAATNMNSESSRSHAVFNMILTQTVTDLQSGVSGEKQSKMSLVDLAGSERAQKTGAVGDRLKEGSNINKSLTTLGLVISALADQAAGKMKNKFVPYRDSVLTWLLKDNLGGNSKTVMVATLSPSADNYEETLSTLRYADRAKRIVNHAVVNEDPNARIIRELREEVESLRKMLDEAQILKSDDLKARLEESEKLMIDKSKTWEEKLEETERIHKDRQAALEKMGISVETSGIKVETNRFYLVNLNADPSLNELLVYYLKDHTVIGRPGAPVEPDIQLNGIGIMAEHCIVNLENNEVYILPQDGARTCVNGRKVTEKTKVKHGDRLLWGNNHFFRVNCPRTANSGSAETPDNIDYDFAQQELMLQQMEDDPISEAISVVEKQHEEDKQEALERQRQMYEKQMQMLRSQLMSPGTPSAPYPPFPFESFSKMSGASPSMHPKYQQWASERELMFKQGIAKLKEEVVRANSLVCEANFLAQEMGKQTEFSVTLQIPAANLSPNRKRGAFVSEPAIQVKHKGKPAQIWPMEKFENKMFDMRDMYEDRKEKGLPLRVENDDEAPSLVFVNGVAQEADSNYQIPSSEDEQIMLSQRKDTGQPVKGDPFYEWQENHNLIGVANIFLEALFYDVKLDYHVPIISQQGEVAGRLHIELCRVRGTLADQENADTDSLGDCSLLEDEDHSVAVGSSIECRIAIREAKGLPPALSNFVFCQYSFWGYPEPVVVPPVVNGDLVNKRSDGMTFRFDHEKDFTVHVNEEFIEHCTDGALSIEVWGHQSQGFGSTSMCQMDQVQAKSRSIMDRWRELTRKLELWTEIHELSDQGEYVPVELTQRPEMLTGGVFQLRQGHSRRILLQVKPVHNSGTLPIICEAITHISIGCVCARSKLQKGLDSYQEEDLSRIREKWSNALGKRREYLDEQLQKIMNKEEKRDADAERERSLIDQWVVLTEERNAVLVPAAGSGIPGAPADWDPPSGMESHIPVIFLDLNAEDMSTPSAREGMQAAGINSILPKEHGAKFFTLPFVKNSEKDVCSIVSWDSSIHDSVHLNRITPANERVYLILKVVVRLSHPASMEVVLRKRVSINVYKRQSITDKLKKRIGKAVSYYSSGASFQDNQFACGVTYEIVSNIPKASEDLEDRESLAQIAASQNDRCTPDGDTYIEKYLKGVSAVESILTLDRLRQDVAIKELLTRKGRPLRKSTSVPNIHNLSLLTPTRSLEDQARSDSTQDLRPGNRFSDDRSLPKIHSMDSFRGSSPGSTLTPTSANKDSISPNKNAATFGLSRPNFLNLRTNVPSGAKPPSKSATGSTPAKLSTLLEEQREREVKPLLCWNHEESEDDEECLKPSDVNSVDIKASGQNFSVSPTSEPDDFQDFQGYEQENTQKSNQSSSSEKSLPHSSTADSLVDVPATKSFCTSMASSGYGSQAQSTQTLSSDDSLSLKSIEEITDVDRHIKPTVRENPDTFASDTGSKPALVAQTSLIDSEIPDDLDSPLKPITPAGDVMCSSNNNVAGLDTVADLGHDESIPEAVTNTIDGCEQNVLNTGESSVCEQPNKSDEEILTVTDGSVKADIVSDHIHVEREDCSLNGVPDADEKAESVHKNDKIEEEEAVLIESDNSNKVNEDTTTEKTGQSSIDDHSNMSVLNDSVGSVTETSAVSEPKTTPVSKTDTSGSSPSPQTVEVKLRKGGTMEVHKNMRTRGRGKSQPIKATYRPMSMPPEMLDAAAAAKDEENSDNDDAMSIYSFGSRADLHRLGEAAIPSWIVIGHPVHVLFSQGPSKAGIVQFIGTSDFAPGNWIGVELDTPEGKNDGSVNGVRYFQCKKRHGIFVRHEKVVMDKRRRSSPKIKTSSTLRRSTGNLAANAGASSNSSTPSFMKPTANSMTRNK